MEKVQINKNNQITNDVSNCIHKAVHGVSFQTNQKKTTKSSKNNRLLTNKAESLKKIHILLFYKFQKIKNPEYFARKYKRACKKLGICGKVLIAKEGVNGSISGTKEQVEKYKEFLLSQNGFEDVKFKEETAFKHPFTKMNVRVRKEIISLKKKININKKGKYLAPKEFLELYNKDDINCKDNKNLKKEDKNKESVIILDARNYYEYDLGRFKNAINPNIKTFREFPLFIEKFKKNFSEKEIKNKKIVMYCTGGIRCEKASAYMKEQGFENVYQLEDGIINFCQQFPNTVWEGKCFVFDKRLMTNINQNNKPISKCINCNEFCDLYRNCKNLKCDKLVIMCVKCQEKLQGCCSKECLGEFLNYARKRAVLKKAGEWKIKEKLQSYVK